MRNLTRIALLVTVVLMAGSIAPADPQSCFDLEHPGACFIGESCDYWLLAQSSDGAALIAQTSGEGWQEFIGPDGLWFVKFKDSDSQVWYCTPEAWAAALVGFPANIGLCIGNYNPDFCATWTPGTLALPGTGAVSYNGLVGNYSGECPAQMRVNVEVSNAAGTRFNVRGHLLAVGNPEGGCDAVLQDLNITPITTAP